MDKNTLSYISVFAFGTVVGHFMYHFTIKKLIENSKELTNYDKFIEIVGNLTRDGYTQEAEKLFYSWKEIFPENNKIEMNNFCELK